jgi:hypothetical protein
MLVDLMTWQSWVALSLIAYIPGALLFRVPYARREMRARLSAEERAYWSVIIALLSSSLVAFGLAAIGLYRLERVVAIQGFVSAVILVAWRARLRFGPAAQPPGVSTLVPLVLVGLGWYLFFPPSEYVIGGRDPGVYFNQGIQIAQRGGLIVRDPVVAAVPAGLRHLFFPEAPGFFTTRFMGFFILDPADGTVVGLFPHLYPIWVAIGYGIHGLTGARLVLGIAAILGVLAVYFAGARLIGRVGAAVGAAFLALNVVQIWFARYPNSEVLTQVLLFAALLAFARAYVDGDPFFGPLSGLLLGLSLFARFDAIVAIGGVLLAVALLYAVRQPLPVGFLTGLGLLVVLAYPYYTRVLRPYATRPQTYLQTLRPTQLVILAMAGALVVAATVVGRRPSVARHLRALVPKAFVCTVITASVYALFFRRPMGKLAPYDAASLVTFTWYVPPAALLAALLGYARLTWRSIWLDPALITTLTFSAFFVFYKTRIVPEHFWMTRRFVPMVLPSALLMVAALALFVRRPREDDRTPTSRRWTGGQFAQALRVTLVVAFFGLVGSQLFAASRPILGHVEYAGVIPALESLAGQFGDEDLVLVESRYASELNGADLHVLALPLAYIYARNVLVLHPLYPSRTDLELFVAWARTQYREIYFLGGGGTPVLSGAIGAEPVGDRVIQVPHYEQRLEGYPRAVVQKKFVFGIYRLTPTTTPEGPFTLDVGTNDDLHVLRFHAKERTNDVTFRWTHPASLIVLENVERGGRRVTLRMSDGGRPQAFPRPQVTVLLNDNAIGTAAVASGFHEYSFAIPPGLLFRGVDPGAWPLLRIVTNSTWSPQAAGLSGDGRSLGVMIDRVAVR